MALKKCPSCGADNSELARLCYACGTDLMNPEDSAEQAVQTEQAQISSAASTEQECQHTDTQLPPPVQPYVAEQPVRQPGSDQAPSQAPYGQPYQQNPYQMPPQGYPYGQPYQQSSYPPTQPFVPLGYRQKSRVAAAILGMLLGVFGVHNFYLGYTGKAVAQLLITILSGFVFSFIPLIWGIVEGIMLLCGQINLDGRNVPLSE